MNSETLISINADDESTSKNYHTISSTTSSGQHSPKSPLTGNEPFVITSQVANALAGPYKYQLSPGDEYNERPVSRTNLQACSYESHVDITDTDAITTVSLHRCQNLVVKRYNTLLKLIGWKPFGREYSFRHSQLWTVLNFLYTSFVISVLLFHYVYTGFFCDSQLYKAELVIKKAHKVRIVNMTTRMIPTSTHAPDVGDLNSEFPFGPPPIPENYSRVGLLHYFNKTTPNKTSASKDDDDEDPIGNSHLITTCVIPSIIHGLIYIYGYFHFRVKENEHLDALMEKVFLQAQTTFGFQEKLIRNTRHFLWLAAVWVVLTLFLFGMSLVVFGLPHPTLIHSLDSLPRWSKILMVALDGLGQFLTACVFVAVVVNYASQCEFLLHSISHICLQLHERQFYLKEAMHEILGMRDQLSQLNRALAKMTSLCVLNFGVMFVIGFGLLIMDDELNIKQLVCRIVNLICWFSILLVPIVQAARMTKRGEKLRQISFEIRVFGYKNCSQLDLDSFILFVSNATLRTKLFSVPVKPAYLVSCAAIIIFILLLLIQTDTIHTNIPEVL